MKIDAEIQKTLEILVAVIIILEYPSPTNSKSSAKLIRIFSFYTLFIFVTNKGFSYPYIVIVEPSEGFILIIICEPLIKFALLI